MKTRLKELMATDFPIVDCNETVADIEAKLTETSFDAIPVLNPDHTVFGMVSQADVIRFHKGNGNVRVTQAWEVCSPRPCMLHVDDSLDHALACYAEAQFREIVVLDRQERLAGLLRSEDLLRNYVANAHLGQADPDSPGVALHVANED